MKIQLKQTCGACPEQYDAFDEKGKQVGYLRLRFGSFTVEYPDSSGELIYSASPKGDGMFNYGERTKYLNNAVRAIKEKIAEMEDPEREYEII